VLRAGHPDAARRACTTVESRRDDRSTCARKPQGPRQMKIWRGPLSDRRPRRDLCTRRRPRPSIDGAASPEDAGGNAASQRVVRAPRRDDPPGMSRLADSAQRTPPSMDPSRVGDSLQSGPSACQPGTGNPRGVTRTDPGWLPPAITSPRDVEWSRRLFLTHVPGMDLRNLEAPPGFEPGIEVLQTGPGRLSCGLALLAGRPSPLVVPGVRAQLFPSCSQLETHRRPRRTTLPNVGSRVSHASETLRRVRLL
jgi:hypothetical protein